MKTDKQETKGRKTYYAPVAHRKGGQAVGKKSGTSANENGRASADGPMEFYSKVSKRTDVRNILHRLAKD